MVLCLPGFIFLAMFLIVLIGIIGNASIIIIILWNKVLRLQPTNLFLLNMAVSDLMNLCINPTLYLFKRDVLFTNYYLSKVFCFLTPFFTGKFKLRFTMKKIDLMPNICINIKYCWVICLLFFQLQYSFLVH